MIGPFFCRLQLQVSAYDNQRKATEACFSAQATPAALVPQPL